MKKMLLLLAVAMFGVIGANAEPMQPLQTTVLSTMSSGTAFVNNALNSTPAEVEEGQEVIQNKDVYEASFVTADEDPNMIPQNAAAKGLPVPERRQPRVRIQTKQRSQGNAYWNPGGKGTKSYF